jgi:DNA-binding NarL/FixJ family response regulator
VLVHRGTWSEAEKELTAAIAVLGTGRRSTLLEGTARLGELRRRQGRLDEARTLFLQSELHSVAKIGVVELALDDGDAASALALAERLERTTDAQQRLSRVVVLLLLVRAAAAASRPESVRDAVTELEQLADVVGTNGARAAAARARGTLELADGDPAIAARRFEDAIDLYGLAAAPYERAHSRLSLARALRAQGFTDRALAEAEAAHIAFQELDAQRAAAEAAELLRLLGSPTLRANGPLTSREVQVIALVSAGRSNREIAEELVVSEHTVHRHVANILRKLDEPTRAAAATRATRDGLI